ncbi:MAG: hypothetical protein U0797_13605 [Gemmataceae bacterium]
MTGPRSASLLLVLTLGAAIAGSPPVEECAPPAPPGPLRPTAAPPPPGPRQPAPRPLPAGDFPPPSVSVRVRVPAEAAPGQELTYKILVDNPSRASAHHVTVRVNIPNTAARFVRATPEPAEVSPVFVWKLGTLAPLARREISLVMLPTGDEEVSCCARVQFEHGQCVRTRVGKGAPAASPRETKPSPITRTPPLTPVPTPPKAPPAEKQPQAEMSHTEPAPPAELEVRKTGPTEAARYDMVAYKLEVRNLGRGTARNVVVRDALPKGIGLSESKPAEASQNPLTWNLGDLSPGGSKVVQYKVIPDVPGQLKSTVTVEAEGVARREAQHTLFVGQPALAVTATGPKARGPGRDTTYHITVSNPGDLAATNVQLVDDLTADMEFIRASAGGAPKGNQVRWSLGTLAPGARRTVQVTLRARRAGTFKNVCTATADRGLTEQGGAGTKFEAPHGLAVEIDPERDSVEVGRTLDVVVRVHNPGRANETNVVASIALPEGLALVDVPGVTGHTVKGSKVELPRKALAGGEESYVTLRFQGQKAGPAKVAAEVQSDAQKGDRAARADETIAVLPAPR